MQKKPFTKTFRAAFFTEHLWKLLWYIEKYVHSILVSKFWYIGFSWTPFKNWLFQWASIILNFSSLTSSHLLKVSKFLTKISKFKFLVMTEKDIFVYKTFFITKYFRFQFIFYAKTTISLKKVAPLLPRNPSKNWDPVKPHPPFGSTPSQKRGTHYVRIDSLKRNAEQPLQGTELRETEDKDEKLTGKLIRWNRKIKNIYQFRHNILEQF